MLGVGPQRLTLEGVRLDRCNGGHQVFVSFFLLCAAQDLKKENSGYLIELFFFSLLLLPSLFFFFPSCLRVSIDIKRHHDHGAGEAESSTS